jgi:non-specific serine/threonine protein kinase
VLAREPTLILLDNFEQIAGVAPVLVEMLAHSPLLKLVVTSRAGLQVAGEYEWEVPPLELPALVGGGKLAGLAHIPSVELLIERAVAVDRNFALTAANADAIAAVCVRLEGVPLAIELAAAWLKLFSPGMLLARLQQGLPVLSDDMPIPADHQRTLHDAIAWSEALLTPSERDVFHQLSLFTGGWKLDAVQAICVYDETRSVEEIMLSLANKSLIARHTLSGDEDRYRMLAMIRAFAHERLVQSGGAREARDRHAGYYEQVAAEAAGYLDEHQQAEWLDRLEHEHGNLRDALRWLLDGRQRGRAIALAANLENFWILHDHLFEGQRWLEEALRMFGDIPPELEARARSALGAVLLRKGAYVQARALVQANFDFAEQSGNLELAAKSLHALGIIASFAGDPEQSEMAFRAALDLARQIDDQRTVARVLNHLGGLSRYRGDDAAAIAYYEESLAIWRRFAVPERIAMVLHNMAPVVARQGDLQRSCALFDESLNLSWDLRNVHGIALCLMGIAGIARRSGTQAVLAAQLLGAADALRASIGAQWDPDDRAEQDRSCAVVRSLLDEASFAAAISHGEAIPVDDAVSQAKQMLKAMAAAMGSVEPGRASRLLTKREQEIVLQISLGRTNREIADLLSISDKTVEMHVSHSLSKLGYRSRAQLAAWAVESGARVDLDPAGEIIPR